jgi:adenine-specific DNA-methyltransferase
MFREKILPNINSNICMGNALVDLTFYNHYLRTKDRTTFLALLDKAKMFVWEESFPAVFKQGGFDVIIGNPPYVKEYTNKEAFEFVKETHLKKYYQGKMDLCYFFICRGIDLLKENGLLGYIIPNNWTTNTGASILREKVVTESTIRGFYDFGKYNVFDSSSIQTMILILEKYKQEQYTFDYRRLAHATPNIAIVESLLAGEESEGLVYLQPTLNVEERKEALLVFEDSEVEKVLKKIQAKRNFTLDARNEVAQGIVAPQDFLDKNGEKKLRYSIPRGSGIFCITEKERKAIRPNSKERRLLKPFYTPAQLKRFVGNPDKTHWIIYTTSDFKHPSLMKDYPNIKNHLDKFKKVITSHNKPYGLHRARDERFFQGEKIISVRKCARPTFTYTEFDCYVTQTFFVIKTERINQKYLTAILNSQLVAFWLRHRGKMQGLQYQVDKEPLLNIPLVDTDDKAAKKKIIEFVDELLQLYPMLDSSLLGKRSHIENNILYVEKEINKLVYQLYGLTDEKEIAIVEGT